VIFLFWQTSEPWWRPYVALNTTSKQPDDRDPGDETAKEIVRPDTEWVRVREWKTRMLLDAGFTPPDARLLAQRRDLDYRDAIGLLEHGCPREQVVEILL